MPSAWSSVANRSANRARSNRRPVVERLLPGRRSRRPWRPRRRAAAARRCAPPAPAPDPRSPRPAPRGTRGPAAPPPRRRTGARSGSAPSPAPCRSHGPAAACRRPPGSPRSRSPGCPNCASSPATTRSQAIASSQPPPSAKPADRRDHRRPQAPDPVERGERVRLAQRVRRLRGQLADVGPRGERPLPGPRDHDRAARGVVVEDREQLAQLRDQVERERVELVGPVEREQRHPGERPVTGGERHAHERGRPTASSDGAGRGRSCGGLRRARGSAAGRPRPDGRRT